MREKELLEAEKEVRDQLVERVEVLEKVKELNLIPRLDGLTTTQVAEFYQVTNGAIRMVVQRHRDELESDGLNKMSQKEILSQVSPDVSVDTEMSYKTLYYKNEKVKISNFGMNIWPKRAVLRVGMLLRDSEVAKAVRTLLLNVYHDVEHDKENILENINKELSKEQVISLRLEKSVKNKDIEGILQESSRLVKIKTLRANELDQEIKKIKELSKLTHRIKELEKEIGRLYKWNL